MGVKPASVRACVRALTLSNMNISATSKPIATKFYSNHHWGGGGGGGGGEGCIRVLARSDWNSGVHDNG